MSRHSPIAATQRSLGVLENLVGSPGLSLAELAKRTGLTRAHIWKITTGLEVAGYIARNPATGHYVLTNQIVVLARRHMDAVRFLDLCQPHLDALAQKTRELVQLALLEGSVLRFVAKADGPERITVRSLLGREVDLHATATGKAWLSTLPENEAIAIFRQRGMQRFTPKTVVSVERLRLALQRVRELGYAVVEGEHLEEANAIAAPLVPPNAVDGKGVGAVVVTGPSFRLTPERYAKLAVLVRRTAGALASLWVGTGGGIQAPFPDVKTDGPGRSTRVRPSSAIPLDKKVRDARVQAMG